MGEKREDGEHRWQDAYRNMMQRVRDYLEQAEQRLHLHEAVDGARDKAVELGELTREEAEKIGDYLKRDVEDTAMHMAESREEFRDWLALDLSLMERQVVEMLLGIADKTSVELGQLREQAVEANLYHTGEMAAPGTLQCIECGHLLHMKTTGHIPPCAKCRGTTFKRIPSAVL